MVAGLLIGVLASSCNSHSGSLAETGSRPVPAAPQGLAPPRAAVAPGPGPDLSPAQAVDAPPCRSRQLRVSYGGLSSLMTDEQVVPINVRDGGRSACVLDGYPLVELFHHEQEVPFPVRDGGLHTLFERPERVELRPGQSARFDVAKMGCAVQEERLVTSLRVTLPDTTARVAVSLSRARRSSQLYYCAGDGRPGHPDPENNVGIGPITHIVDSG